MTPDNILTQGVWKGFMAGSWGSVLLIFDETPGLLHDSEVDKEGLFAQTPGSFASGD